MAYVTINERLERLRAKLSRRNRAPAPVNFERAVSPHEEPEEHRLSGPVCWRYFHKKGYWQIWSDVPADGIIVLPHSARAVQLSPIDEISEAERSAPPDPIDRFWNAPSEN